MKVTKQWIANVLNHLNAENISGLDLPEHDGSKNSDNDDRVCADTWYAELYNLGDVNPRNTIRVGVDGVDLACYNIIVDGAPYHLVFLDYEMVEPDGAFFDVGHCPDAATALYEWLGNTSLEDYDIGHAITHIAAKIAE